MRSKRLKNDLFIILITSFVVIVCWIGFNIYNHSVTSTIDETLAKQIIPIPGTFDRTTIESLNNRRRVQPLYRLENISPTPTPPLIDELFAEDSESEAAFSPLPTASPSASQEIDFSQIESAEILRTLQDTQNPSPGVQEDFTEESFDEIPINE